MGKLIILPGVELFPPSRNELVEDATETVMKEVLSAFAEQQFSSNDMSIWYREVREYFWKQEFKLVNRNFKEDDVRRWKAVWREKALDYVRSKRIR